MDIKQAIERVNDLKNRIRKLDGALKASEKTEYGSLVEVSAEVFVHGFGTLSVSLDRDTCLKALQDTKAGCEARVAKLQPVIDMANAALKGVLS